MHAILDAETAGSMGFLDSWFRERGGRRGREQRRTPTSGLTYAVTRHGTSRAGDPHPHDHIPIANVAEMLDERGGWKALDSAALRDLSGPAEMVGRLHSAARAVELGYRIERDDGESGRKRAWRIVGIADEVWGLYCTRHDEIDEHMATRGYDSATARNVAADATRPVKRFTGVDELMPRWHAELEAIGWTVERLADTLDAARAGAPGLAPPLTAREVDALGRELVDARGEFLRRSKVFTRSRLIEEVAPALYGHDPAELDAVLDHILASREVVPLVGIEGAREQAYSTATVLATEARIAAAVERLAATPGPQVGYAEADAAMTAKEAATGHRLTPGQQDAVLAVATSGRRLDVIVGVAGAGKTTALDAATTALEDAGYRVIGTSTSSTATRTLRNETGTDAATIAKLVWRLDHGDLTLDPRTVVIVDEAAMTADADLLRLVIGVERAGAKLVLVGDHRQLAAIGPGGAFEAVIERHPDIAVTMDHNVRQTDPSERAALAQLRHGDVPVAIDWYATNNRTLVAPTRLDALTAMVDAWAADVDAGHDAAMLAYLRRDVDALNRLARMNRQQAGHVTGPEVTAPGGRRYAQGDRVVLTAPINPKDLVNAERATVAAVDPQRGALTIRTDNGRTVTLDRDEIDDQHLDWGYALTVHRTQAATVDRVHVFADGGGRQLGYVAMSRARQRATVHAVADDLDQALEDIQADWTTDRRQRWLTDTATPGHHTQPLPVDPDTQLRHLRAELADLEALAPPDVTAELHATIQRLVRLQRDRRDLDNGEGRWVGSPESRAARRLADARAARLDAQRRAEAPGTGRRDRRRWAKAAQHHAAAEALAHDDWATTVEPVAHRIDARITLLEHRRANLTGQNRFRHRWLHHHPDVARHIERTRRRIEDPERAGILDGLDQIPIKQPEPRGHEHGHGIGL